MGLFVRFTDDIDRDIKKGCSQNFKTGEDLGGICAWSMSACNVNPHDDKAIAAAGHEFAQKVFDNSYGGYSGEGEYVIVEADYLGSFNGGELIDAKSVRVIDSGYCE